MNRAYLLRGAMALAMGLSLTVVGCSDDPVASKAGTFSGPVVTVGSGTAKSWVKLDDAGNPTSIGLTLSETALSSLPMDSLGARQFVLTLPAEASATGYDHIGLDWGPQGHPPMHIYGLPHLDMHFYTISQATRAQITMDSANALIVYKQPAADEIPAGYITVPDAGVPSMGNHWFDVTSPELDTTHHHVFDKTFIYGFYDGKLAFMEPMITKAYLETKPSNVSLPISQPAKFPKVGAYYGTKYTINYDATAKEYTISLDGLKKQS